MAALQVMDWTEEDSDSSEDEESLEYQSLCKHSSELSFVIRRNPEKFAEDLFGKHIISDRLLSDIRKRRRGKRRIDPYSDHNSEKAKKLLDVVKNVIQTDPGKLKVLLEVVNQYAPYVAKKLQHSCAKKTNRWVFPSSIPMRVSVDALLRSYGSRVRTISNMPSSSIQLATSHTKKQLQVQERNQQPSDHSNLFRVKDLEVGLDAQIGTGSFGDVWKGTRSGSPCAVKVLRGVSLFLPLHGNVEAEKRKRFERECMFLEQLKHPNIVRYLQRYIHPETGTIMLVMELMDENLSSFLNRQMKTPGARLRECIQVKICMDVAQALSYLHANHLVHRDLSSNNILLSTQMVSCQHICAKVSDFGISRLIDSERFDKTLSTLAPGTKGYMPPESWISHRKYDEKFDIFSFGVLTVQTITMLPPNPSDRVDSSIKIVPEVKRCKDHLQQIEGHKMQDVVSRCLRDDTTARPTANEICCILQQLLIPCNCHYYHTGNQFRFHSVIPNSFWLNS